MGLHSGKWAAVNGVPNIHQWSISETQSPAKGRASNTALAPIRKRGVHQWSGSYSAYGGTPTCMPGVLFGFVGFGAPDDDVSGAGQRYSGNAIVDSVAITWNWATGECISHVVSFSGHIDLTKASGNEPADATTPVMPPIAPCKIKYGAVTASADGDFTNVAALTQAVLTISSENQSFVNSDTVVGTGASAKLWTGRKAGVPDWTLALSQQDNLRVGAPFDIGDDISLRLYVDATTYWLLKWGHVRDFTGITADRNTGAIIGRTVNVDWNAYASPGLGVVTDPSGTQWWPFS